ncbi:MAG: hypothetical protein R3Y58_07305 [Eubacteriales bacterium]
MLKEEVPIRLGMSLAMDSEALEVYANLSDKKKQKIIKKSMKIENKKDMDKFVSKIHG